VGGPELLVDGIQVYGEGSWRILAARLGFEIESDLRWSHQVRIDFALKLIQADLIHTIWCEQGKMGRVSTQRACRGMLHSPV
jgi:hypothetical protein